MRIEKFLEPMYSHAIVNSKVTMVKQSYLLKMTKADFWHSLYIK